MTTNKENTRRDRGGRIEHANGTVRVKTRHCEFSETTGQMDAGIFGRQTGEIVAASARLAAGIVQVAVRNNGSEQSKNDA